MIDSDGDGVADKSKIFATGFNCIQGLAWHGKDLWVGNSPDLTVVRDLDGDDVADEYVLLSIPTWGILSTRITVTTGLPTGNYTFRTAIPRV